MRRNSSSSSVSNTPSPNYQNRRRSSKSASPGNRKKKNVISPRRIVENSQIFHQEHILNQKLSRELRHARRELKREAYFANLRISKLTEQAKNATKNLDQAPPLDRRTESDHVESETLDILTNTHYPHSSNNNFNHRLTMSDEDLDNSIVSHSTTTFRKRRRRNISTQNNRNNANRLDNISFEETLESESTETFDIMSISSPSVSKSNRGETFIGFQDPRNIGTNAQLRTTDLPPPGSLCVVRFDPGEPERIRFLTLPTMKIVDLSCAPKERDIAILDGNTGKVFIFDAWCWDSEPEEVTSLKNRKITKIKSCSGRNLAVVTADGEALLLESPQHSKDHTIEHLARQLRIVESIRIPGEHIIAIEKFDQGIAVLTKRGTIYTRGKNPFNLGHENPAQSPNEFRLLKSLQHEHIIQISFSDFHACALGKNGTVYSWGCPDEGRLGLGQFETSDHHSTIYQPTRIDFFKTQRIVKVEAGHFVSAMLTDTGQIYTCGAGKYMTLGHGSQQDEWLPRRIDYLADRITETEFIVDFYLSGFQLTLISNYGRVYVCGMDSYTYAPGRDNERWNTTPHPLSPALNRLYVEKAAGSFAMALLIGKTPVIEVN